MIASPALIVSVRTGPVAPLGPRQVPSAFVKRPADGPVVVGPFGLAGDAQADRRVHGGRDKPVYAYPAAAYAVWRAAVPHHAARFGPGAMGENLTVDGWGDGDVAIGDEVRAGRALLQVSEPRTPCYKLGLAFGDAEMIGRFAAIGISGWYYRVIEPGDVAPGDTMVCLARPNPGWTIARFSAAVSRGPIDRADLTAIIGLDGLAAGWQRKASRLLARRGGV